MRARWRLGLLHGALLALLPSASIAAPLRVLLVGNSHTYTNDLPRAVAALAAQRGIEVDTTMLAEPGYSLADHLAGPRLRRMLQQQWDWVVLQQGPSSLPESRRDLVASTQAIAQLLRARTGAEARDGATPAPRLALISIWPQRRYRASSLAAEASYRAAAAAVEACVFPAATAWRLAQQSGAAPRLYQSDQLHATRAGTVLMALTVLPGLIGEARSGLEARVGDADAAESDAVRALQAAAWQAHRDEPQRCRTP
jgi:hypothetical protein